MANHVSAVKATRITERRTEVNRMRRTRLRHQIRTMRRAMDKKDHTEAEKLLPATFSIVDRAAKWGIIKKNTAARYKSRLTLRLKKLSAAA
ncbi:MAG: 30S ribosomal protein S20 [Acidobacteria bacterium]|nr:30S ribosomal protein S20 [Acidobacteriota bacterium]